MQIVIDKDKEINKLKETLNNLTDENDIQSINFAIFILENIGTPLPKGRWINLEKTKYKGQTLPFWDRYECSECGGHGQGNFKHCPNCGAQMEADGGR